jgi:DNA invertase Pin-like site-specific DNA recombinase
MRDSIVPVYCTHSSLITGKPEVELRSIGRRDLARSTKHLLLALEEFRSLGIQLISYQENIDTSSALEQALFTIVSAVAQLERDLIRERVSAGIRNARANGKKFGRPKSGVDRERIMELKAEGHSLRHIAAELGVGYGTVRARLLTSHKL